MPTFFMCCVCFGCADEFNLQEWLNAQQCDNSAHIFFIDDNFSADHLEIIAEAINYTNEILTLHNCSTIQVCGLIPQVDDLETSHMIKRVCYADYPGYIGGISSELDIKINLCGNIHGYDHFKKTFLHELGHYLGGHHTQNPTDIMCQGWNGTTEFSAYDIAQITENGSCVEQ